MAGFCPAYPVPLTSPRLSDLCLIYRRVVQHRTISVPRVSRTAARGDKQRALGCWNRLLSSLDQRPRPLGGQWCCVCEGCWVPLCSGASDLLSKRTGESRSVRRGERRTTDLVGQDFMQPDPVAPFQGSTSSLCHTSLASQISTRCADINEYGSGKDRCGSPADPNGRAKDYNSHHTAVVPSALLKVLAIKNTLGWRWHCLGSCIEQRPGKLRSGTDCSEALPRPVPGSRSFS